MKQSLLRTVLRKEMVGLARVTVLVLTAFLFLLEFGYRADAATGLLLDQLSYGLVLGAVMVALGSGLRAKLRDEPVRNAEFIWFVLGIGLLLLRPFDMEFWPRHNIGRTCSTSSGSSSLSFPGWNWVVTVRSSILRCSSRSAS
jgi:hypothetical protein